MSLHADAGAHGARGPATWVHSRSGEHSRALARSIHREVESCAGYGRGVHAGELALLTPEVLHSSTAACLIEVDNLADPHGEWALTMLALTDYRTNPLLLPAEPTGFANASNGNFGFFIMDGQPFLEQLDYQTLLHEEIELKSHPVYVGVLPDLDPTDGVEPQAWASQDHELGRISFLDPLTQSVETITGFELNAQIGD